MSLLLATSKLQNYSKSDLLFGNHHKLAIKVSVTEWRGASALGIFVINFFELPWSGFLGEKPFLVSVSLLVDLA